MNVSDLMQEPLYPAWILLKRVYPPILFTFGLLGNFLSVLTLRKRKLTSTSILLTSLAVTDSFVLTNCVLKNWIENMIDFKIHLLSDAMCKFETFLYYFLLQLSPWLMVLITCERAYSVLRPASVRHTITIVRTLVAVCLLVIILVGINAHVLYTFNLINNHCYAVHYEQFMFKIWTWVDMMMAFGLPFVFLLTGNVIILIRIRSSERFRTTSVYSTTNGTNVRVSRNRVSQWTAITLTLNTAFIVLVMPSVVFGIGQYYWFPPPLAETYVQMKFTSTIVFMLMYLNSAINFVFYMMLGSRFRADLKDLLSCVCTCWKPQSRRHSRSTELTSVHSNNASHGTHAHIQRDRSQHQSR